MNLRLPLLAALLLATPALADSDSGLITNIDLAAGKVTLQNGVTYAAPKSVDISVLQVGEKVTVTYDMKDSKVTVSAIRPAF